MLEKHTKMFRFSSCNFSISEYKKSAAWAYIFYNLDVPFCYTFESSVSHYYEDGINFIFTIQKYE